MSGRRSGSLPYSVTESNAVDSRFAGMPSASRWKRRLVRNASPSPANMRVGSSFSRLNANTPAVNGKAPGHVLPQLPAQDLAVVLERRQRDLADLRAGQRRRRELGADLLVADLHDVLVARVRGLRLRPHVEELPRPRVELRVAVGERAGRARRRPCRISGREHRLHRAQLLALARDRASPCRPTGGIGARVSAISAR